MCFVVHYGYRCGCSHTTVFQCPRIGAANAQRLSPAYLVHGCSHRTTQLDEPCQECEEDPFGDLGRPEAGGDADAHRVDLATPTDEQQALGAGREDDDDLENVDPNDVEDDAEHGPASDGGPDGAGNENPVSEGRNGRRVLGDITLNLR